MGGGLERYGEPKGGGGGGGALPIGEGYLVDTSLQGPSHSPAKILRQAVRLTVDIAMRDSGHSPQGNVKGG